MSKRLPVVEVFGPTVQGEGALSGLRTMFVRFGGCDGVDGLRNWCTWCDSMHAVDPINKEKWRWIGAEDIVEELQKLAPWCRYVTISGGNPGILDLTQLVHYLNDVGYGIAVETQGTAWKDWMADLDTITVSPKPPSAGADHEAGVAQFERWFVMAQGNLDRISPTVMPVLCVKTVVDVSDERDFDFAEEIVKATNANHTLEFLTVKSYLSVMTHPDDSTDELLDKWRILIAWLAYHKSIGDIAVLPQLHVLLWGHRLGV